MPRKKKIVKEDMEDLKKDLVEEVDEKEIRGKTDEKIHYDEVAFSMVNPFTEVKEKESATEDRPQDDVSEEKVEQEKKEPVEKEELKKSPPSQTPAKLVSVLGEKSKKARKYLPAKTRW